MSDRTPGRSLDSNTAHRAQLAATFVERLAALDDLGEQATSEETRPLVRKLGEAALELALSIAERSLPNWSVSSTCSGRCSTSRADSARLVRPRSQFAWPKH